jgi:hypothetical protein
MSLPVSTTAGWVAREGTARSVEGGSVYALPARAGLPRPVGCALDLRRISVGPPRPHQAARTLDGMSGRRWLGNRKLSITSGAASDSWVVDRG